MAYKRVKSRSGGLSSWSPPRVVLASESPRRHEFLNDLGIKFDVVGAQVEERFVQGQPRTVVIELARRKVKAVNIRDAIVIGMDTLVFLGNGRFEKPQDASEAVQMLKDLSNRRHRVITGVCLRYGTKYVTDAESTDVYFRRLSYDEINWYVKTGEPLDKAGAYAIQGYGRLFVSKINGCYFNVVGFPISCFQRALQRLGFSIYDLIRT